MCSSLPCPCSCPITNLPSISTLNFLHIFSMKTQLFYHIYNTPKKTFRIWFQNNIWCFERGKNWVKYYYFCFLASLKQIIYNILAKSSQIFIKPFRKLTVVIPRWFKQTNKKTKQINKKQTRNKQLCKSTISRPNYIRSSKTNQ